MAGAAATTRDTSRQRRTRHVVAQLAFFAALGSALSVAVAALSAVWLPLPAQRSALPADSAAARRMVASLGPLPSHWGQPTEIRLLRGSGLTRVDVSGLLRPDVSASGAFIVTRITAGFPARALVAQRRWDSEAGDLSASAWRAGVALPSRLRPWQHNPSRYNSILPLRPLAASLAINTLTWAAALWLLLHSAQLTRRAWRRRRGRCPTCGYPKPDDPAPGPVTCPECGAVWGMSSRADH